jgi:hypothetical protein
MELNESLLADLAEWFFNPEAPAPASVTASREDTALQCFDKLFLWPPMFYLNTHTIDYFDRIIAKQFQSIGARIIDYTLPYPKYFFLNYLLDRGYLLHGTKSSNVDALEPREQIDWNGNSIQAVFATQDAIWPMYFALLERSKLTGSLRNGCFIVEPFPSQLERFYFFSVNHEYLDSSIWSDGFVYILPGETFQRTTRGSIRFDEWASEQAVPAVAKLPVSPDDFPFLHQVSGHNESESIFTTWLRYKARLKAG